MLRRKLAIALVAAASLGLTACEEESFIIERDAPYTLIFVGDFDGEIDDRLIEDACAAVGSVVYERLDKHETDEGGEAIEVVCKDDERDVLDVTN